MARLARDAYEHYVPLIGAEPAPMSADYALAVPDGWVVFEADRLVAMMIARPAEGDMIVETLAVVPDRRGRGLGSRLLLMAEELARQDGPGQVRLYTNAAMSDSVAWYRRHGYRQTHRAEQDGYQRVFFAKPASRDGEEP